VGHTNEIVDLYAIGFDPILRPRDTPSWLTKTIHQISSARGNFARRHGENPRLHANGRVFNWFRDSRRSTDRHTDGHMRAPVGLLLSQRGQRLDPRGAARGQIGRECGDDAQEYDDDYVRRHVVRRDAEE
jgi:hypothetical protein